LNKYLVNAEKILTIEPNRENIIMDKDQLERLKKLQHLSFADSEQEVREVFITPLLRELGYESGTKYHIDYELPSKLKIGSKKAEPVKIDYVISVGNEIKWILDAKSIHESVWHRRHIEQAHHYATIKTINVKLYALCNGEEFALYSSEDKEYKPIFHFKRSEIIKRWNEITDKLSGKSFDNQEISDKFKGAVQKTDQEQKILALQAEVEKLRALQSPELEAEISKLREQLQTQVGDIAIDINLIDPNPNQPRQTITTESIQAKARLLKKHGQITPIILVPDQNGRYMLLDGQLRWEGAKLLGWETIRALIVPQPEDLDQSSLLTFLGFEDLNPLDKAEAIFKEITKSTGLELDEVTTSLAAVIKRVERNNQVNLYLAPGNMNVNSLTK
jgi:ParB/RepB/Spo0J family partition protein